MISNHARAALALLSAALMLAVGNVRAADTVTTRAGLHDGFGRLVFEWAVPVEFQAELDDDILTVKFARALETDLTPVRQLLSGYIAGASVAGDGRSLEFQLSRPMEMRAFAYDNKIVVDLAEQSPGAGGGPVRVRAGDHPGYSRIVFDWPRYVDYSVRKDGNLLTVVFSRPGPLDLSGLNTKLPRFVRSARGESSDGRAKVIIGLSKSARLRNFRQGTKIVIDVLGETSDGDADAKAAPGQASISPRRADAPAKDAKSSDPAPAKATALRPPRRLIPASKQVATDVPGAELPAAEAPAAKSHVVERRELPGRVLRVSAPASPAMDRAADAAPPASLGESDAKPSSGARVGALEMALEEGVVADGRDSLKVAILGHREGRRLLFGWQTPVAAAVFRRAGYLWVVFDRPARADLSGIKRDPAAPVIAVMQAPNRRATLLRFKVQPGLFPVVSRRDAAWIVDLANETVAVKETIQIKAQPHAALGARLFIPLIDLGERVSLTDPEVGDRLVVVPAAGSIRAVAVNHELVEAKILATAHGVAIAPRSEDIKVHLLRNGIVITKHDGLLISGGDGRQVSAMSKRLDAGGARRLHLRFANWRKGPPERFIETKQELLYGIATAPAGGRNDERLKLAQFYFAHGLAADAHGVLSVIEEHDPRVVSVPGFRALRGATSFYLNRLDDAAEDLFNAAFDGNREIAVWRGAVSALKKDWARAQDAYALGTGAVESYPKDLRIRFLMLDARTALATNDIERLETTLAALEATDPPADIRLAAALFQGRAKERLGDFDAALGFYRRASASDHRRVRARAEFAQVKLLLKKGDLITREAVDRLDKLRFAWRGGDFELELLPTLAELYIKMGQYREGLGLFRQAVTYFPRDAATRAIAKTMGGHFERLYLDRAADALTPVSALGLYYEFRELTPLGPKGDEMIRRLADRLVAVDLLGRAAKLLEHQVKRRLKGREMARVGARLAIIYLIDKKPGEALRALADTRWKPLTWELISERHRLSARAFADLGRYREALALLKGDKGREADLLRGEIHWRAGSWKDAARTFESILGERWKNEEALSEDERERLMELAVSLALAGDQAGLDRVRARYAPRLAKGADADVFQALTSDAGRGETEYRKLASKIAEVGNLQAFMAGYRKKLASGALSAIN